MAPRLRHFIIRQDLYKRGPAGEMISEQNLVPVIPIDEIPEWIDIIGVPRRLTVEQVAGLRNLGYIEKEATFEAQILPHLLPGSAADQDALTQIFAPLPDVDRRASATATPQTGLQNSRWADCDTDIVDHGQSAVMVPAPTPAPAPALTSATETVLPAAKAIEAAPAPASQPTPASAPVPPTQQVVQSVQAPISTPAKETTTISPSPGPGLNTNTPPIITTTTTTATKPPNPQPTPSDQDPQPTTTKRRIFCRHWCVYGTCKWGPYCRFQHTMPATLEGLSEVGLRDFPAWWTAAMGLTMGGFVTGPGLPPPPPPRGHHHPGGGPGYDLRLGPAGGAAGRFLGGGAGKRRDRDREREMQMQMQMQHALGYGGYGYYGHGLGGGGFPAYGVGVRKERELHPLHHEKTRSKGQGPEAGVVAATAAAGQSLAHELKGVAQEQQPLQQPQQPCVEKLVDV